MVMINLPTFFLCSRFESTRFEMVDVGIQILLSLDIGYVLPQGDIAIPEEMGLFTICCFTNTTPQAAYW
ncbi:hypothetical protein ACJJIU_14290 [Microbulbifer sp. CnH-101-E]|uniref:hypothetical protein n=1 Tax=unclassified Microbulbifer TaxID=2619833 RepID=UPI0040394077